VHDHRLGRLAFDGFLSASQARARSQAVVEIRLGVKARIAELPDPLSPGRPPDPLRSLGAERRPCMLLADALWQRSRTAEICSLMIAVVYRGLMLRRNW
jgi:hypothetical protein